MRDGASLACDGPEGRVAEEGPEGSVRAKLEDCTGAGGREADAPAQAERVKMASTHFLERMRRRPPRTNR